MWNKIVLYRLNLLKLRCIIFIFFSCGRKRVLSGNRSGNNRIQVLLKRLSDLHIEVTLDAQTGAPYTAQWTNLVHASEVCCAAYLRRATLPRLREPLAAATSDGSLRGVLVPLLPPTVSGGCAELVSGYVWTKALLLWVALCCHSPLRSKPKPSTAVGGAAPAVPLIGLWVRAHREGLPENGLW